MINKPLTVQAYEKYGVHMDFDYFMALAIMDNKNGYTNDIGEYSYNIRPNIIITKDSIKISNKVISKHDILDQEHVFSNTAVALSIMTLSALNAKGINNPVEISYKSISFTGVVEGDKVVVSFNIGSKYIRSYISEGPANLISFMYNVLKTPICTNEHMVEFIEEILEKIQIHIPTSGYIEYDNMSFGYIEDKDGVLFTVGDKTYTLDEDIINELNDTTSENYKALIGNITPIWLDCVYYDNTLREYLKNNFGYIPISKAP